MGSSRFRRRGAFVLDVVNSKIDLERFRSFRSSPLSPLCDAEEKFLKEDRILVEFQRILVRGRPYMTSALRGGWGVSPKEDVVRKVA